MSGITINMLQSNLHPRLLLPIHLPAHWALIIVHPQEGDHFLVHGLNSLPHSLQECAHYWIIHEAAKVNVKLDRSTFCYEDVKVPGQRDGVKCGVFVLKHILYTLDNLHLDTDLCSMNQHREKWAVDMLRGRMEHVIPHEFAID
jgi:Ulp1 family protease